MTKANNRLQKQKERHKSALGGSYKKHEAGTTRAERRRRKRHE